MATYAAAICEDGDTEHALQIIMNTVSGQSLELNVSSELPMNLLYGLVRAVFEVTPDVDISLVHAGLILPQTPHFTVAAFGINNGCSLIVVKQPSPRFLTASWDGTAKLWDQESRECLLTFGNGHEGKVLKADFSLDGSGTIRIVSEGLCSRAAPHVVQIWHAATGVCLDTLSGHTARLLSCFVSTGALEHALAYDASQGAYSIWNLETESCVSTLSGHTDHFHPGLNDATFSPDGFLLLTASDDSAVKMWSTTTGTCLSTFVGHASGVATAVFSHDSCLALTASDDGTAKTWSTTTAICLRTFAGHDDVLNSAIFSSNAASVLTTSNDMTAKMWNSASGTCIWNFAGHAHWVSTAIFSFDNKSVITASFDHTCKVWSLATGNCTLTMSGHTDAVLGICQAPTSSERF